MPGGRGLYDNQTSIIATQRIDSKTISVYNGATDIYASKSLLSSIVPPPNTIMKLEDIYSYIEKAQAKGAASGYVSLVLQKGGEVPVNILYYNCSFDGEIKIIAMKNESTAGKLTAERPGSMSDLIALMGNITFSEDAPLLITISNMTNINLVGFSVTLRFAITEQKTV